MCARNCKSFALPDETEWVEFKEAKNNFDSDDLGRYFSVLSNEAFLKGMSCGWPVFGVQHKPRTVVGSQYRSHRPDLDRLKQEVAARTSQRLTFEEIHEVLTPQGRVTFQIPAALRGVPTGWKGHFYGRDGLYERTALSKKSDQLVRQELDALRAEGKLTPDLVFKDPYFLDFLGLSDSYSEKDSEAAILREIERFLLELGAGFAFVERQKRIVIDGEDFYLDLLFYHRGLKRLVLVELKLGTFKAADFGQTTLYLRWLDRYERRSGEQAPIGLILCAGKSDERIELLELDKSGIRVAEYLTELPPKKILQQRFHRAIEEAEVTLGPTPQGRALMSEYLHVEKPFPRSACHAGLDGH